MIKQILLVGLGGGIGSMLRFLTSVVTARYYPSFFFLSTFAVNIIGCFLIGLLLGALGQSVHTNQDLKVLFITGFCGGYTTFSAFAAENVHLMQNNSYWVAMLYIGLSIITGLLAVWLGLTMAK
ncbi:fluoride efflux transporter CrcB [Pontibacter akesuensis]|uniref:Fluoride-specific ion channel FluC n=1 Tax=Pontibacter akesuensis TaxID=388950 RepID=A0A1I7KQ96_9BACT|nr:fluoride efflux transporter CrcB [Pontibacter akesuensis]GHA81442.1 putative fluoride ion transporter CrcB [Pontibacter akesuensis]SFU99617.1 CrcB protein [Pontibacter akesuensis]